MTSDPKGDRSTAWWSALAVPLGSEPRVLLLPLEDPQHRPRLEVPEDLKVVTVSLGIDSPPAVDELDDLAGPVVLAPPAVPTRSRDVVFEPEDGLRLHGEAAVVARLLVGPLEGRRTAAFVTRSLLVSREPATFRAWLDRSFSVDWVLFPGPSGADALGVPGLEMAVLVIGPRRETRDVRLTRLADLREKDPTEWEQLFHHASRREGGEVQNSIVLRDQALGADPWTYRRYSKEYRETEADAAALGESTPLEELAMVVGGIGPKDLTAFVRESRAGDLELTVSTFGRRSLADGELGRPTHMLAEPLPPSDTRLQAGDLLLGLRPEADTLTVVRVPDDALPATFETDLLTVRFRDEVPVQIRELVRGYLGSPHALEWLKAEGALPRLRREHLERLPVPRPKKEVLEALEGLAEAEDVYRGWAEEAREARGELFARSSFADTVPKLLERQRLERERVRAGHDSRSLDYLVRNHYPHPVAVRREALLQKPHSEARARESQECAEIAISIVSFLALVQWRFLQDEDAAGPDGPLPPHLAQYVQGGPQGGRFNFDWGKHRSFLDAVIAASRREDNPLALPIPELATLDVEDPWSRAEIELRNERNKAAHLYRHSPSEIQALSERMEMELCKLLEGLVLLSSVKLAVVIDYSRDALSGDRTAEVQVLRGASRAFPRETIEVREELARNSVGLFDTGGTFHRLTPWLIWEHCRRCEREELFAFARYEGQTAEYVALTTGHPLRSGKPVHYWQQALQQAEADPAGD